MNQLYNNQLQIIVLYRFRLEKVGIDEGGTKTN